MLLFPHVPALLDLNVEDCDRRPSAHRGSTMAHILNAQTPQVHHSLSIPQGVIKHTPNYLPGRIVECI